MTHGKAFIVARAIFPLLAYNILVKKFIHRWVVGWFGVYKAQKPFLLHLQGRSIHIHRPPSSAYTWMGYGGGGGGGWGDFHHRLGIDGWMDGGMEDENERKTLPHTRTCSLNHTYCTHIRTHACMLACVYTYMCTKKETGFKYWRKILYTNKTETGKYQVNMNANDVIAGNYWGHL